MRRRTAVLAISCVLAGLATAGPAEARRALPTFEVRNLSFSYKAEYTGYNRHFTTSQGRITNPRNGSGQVAGKTATCFGRTGRIRSACRGTAFPGRFTLPRRGGVCLPLPISSPPSDTTTANDRCTTLLWGNLPVSSIEEEYYEARQTDGTYQPRRCAERQRRENFAVYIKVDLETVVVQFPVPTPVGSCGFGASWSLVSRPDLEIRMPLRRFLARPGRTVRFANDFQTGLVADADSDDSVQGEMQGTYRSTRILDIRRVDDRRKRRSRRRR